MLKLYELFPIYTRRQELAHIRPMLELTGLLRTSPVSAAKPATPEPGTAPKLPGGPRTGDTPKCSFINYEMSLPLDARKGGGTALALTKPRK